MSSTVEQIKERLGIVDVISSYIKLEKAGANYKAKCPFHSERTPSFFVSPSRGSYYCFGCSAKGDMISFVQEFEGLDFMGALKVLADRAGIEIAREDPKAKSEREQLFSVLEKATGFFQENLAKEAQALAYLEGRGLNKNLIKEWKIGFARDEWRSLLSHFISKGIQEKDLEKAGLIKRSEKGSGYYDRFRSRIMFPIFDTSGRVVGFSGRIFALASSKKDGSDVSEAKYLNSPETELFDKSRTLYGLHAAKGPIRQKDYSILVEGQMDLLMCHQAGFSNTIATSGTSLTEAHLEVLKRHSNRLIIAYDADDAGIAASERAWRSALGMGMEIKMCRMPKGKDPADLIKEDLESWRDALKHSKHIIDFYLGVILESETDRRKLGKLLETKVLPYVASLESTIEKSHYTSLIADKAGIHEEAIRAEIKKWEKKLAGSEPVLQETATVAKKETALRVETIERKIAAALLWLDSVATPIVDPVPLREELKKILGDTRYQSFIATFTPEKDQLIFEAEHLYGGGLRTEADLKELLVNLTEERLKADFAKAMEELSLAEKMKEKEKVAELLKRCQQLSEEIRKLSRDP